MRIALGPLLYYWPRETVLDFYRDIASSAADIVYLGETVCTKRHLLHLNDWLEIAQMLAAAGKEVVLSTPVLIESESDAKLIRRIGKSGDFAVEANDMGAVQMVAGKTPFVAGPFLNIYNPQTLEFFHTLGAKRWVMPLEMARASLETMQQNRPAQMETEVFAYGRLPLAFSARCFTARRHNLPKDDCRFYCLEDPQGMALRTRESEDFLVVNGVQIQSARIYNLIGALPDMARLNVDSVRISPQPQHTVEVLALFRAALAQRTSPAEAMQHMLALMPQGACDGYWHGRPGLEQVQWAPAAPAKAPPVERSPFF